MGIGGGADIFQRGFLDAGFQDHEADREQQTEDQPLPGVPEMWPESWSLHGYRLHRINRLRGDRLHWLLTDGAHAALLDWPAGQQPDRVIQVATVQRNVGLERLSARRNAHDPDRIDLLLRLSNGGASPETRDKFLRNMSKRAAEMISEEIQFMGPVKLRDVEEAQQKIVDSVRRLEDAGEVVISGRGGGDEIVV